MLNSIKQVIVVWLIHIFFRITYIRNYFLPKLACDFTFLDCTLYGDSEDCPREKTLFKISEIYKSIADVCELEQLLESYDEYPNCVSVTRLDDVIKIEHVDKGTCVCTNTKNCHLKKYLREVQSELDDAITALELQLEHNSALMEERYKQFMKYKVSAGSESTKVKSYEKYFELSKYLDTIIRVIL